MAAPWGGPQGQKHEGVARLEDGLGQGAGSGSGREIYYHIGIEQQHALSPALLGLLAQPPGIFGAIFYFFPIPP